jgi:hypothetical protein
MRAGTPMMRNFKKRLHYCNAMGKKEKLEFVASIFQKSMLYSQKAKT